MQSLGVHRGVHAANFSGLLDYDGREVSKPWHTVAALAVASTALAGCGGSSPHRGAAGRVTVQAYDAYPPDTISVAAGSPDSPTCRLDARAFAHTSVYFLAHSGPESAYPADLYYVLMREELADFEARRCSLGLLGSALDRRLTARQRRALVADLPREMASVVHEGLSTAGS
jgi:hypothetical protein